MWRHVALVITSGTGDTSGASARLYMDGVLYLSNVDHRFPSTAVASATNYIGESHWSADDAANYYIDDFRIYKGILTLPDVQVSIPVSLCPLCPFPALTYRIMLPGAVSKRVRRRGPRTCQAL